MQHFRGWRRTRRCVCRNENWLGTSGIPAGKMLTSQRAAAAPNLAQILTLDTAREDLPDIPQPAAEVKETAMFLPPNALQRTMVSAQAVRQGHDPAAVLAAVNSRQDVRQYLQNPRRN